VVSISLSFSINGVLSEARVLYHLS
jgi:hypothetical protein